MSFTTGYEQNIQQMYVSRYVSPVFGSHLKILMIKTDNTSRSCNRWFATDALKITSK